MDNCPHCKVSLIGEPIPEEMRKHYMPPYRWRREIGIEDAEIYDGVLHWMCPDCKGTWPSEFGRLSKLDNTPKNS